MQNESVDQPLDVYNARLILRLIDRDAQAWREFEADFGRAAKRAAGRIDTTLNADAWQETCSLIMGDPKLLLRVRDLVAWTRTVTIRHCLAQVDKFRRNRKRIVTLDETRDQTAKGMTPDEAAAMEEHRQLLDWAIAGLTPPEYRCVIEFRLQDKSYEEIVELLGTHVTPDQLRVWHARAKQQLKERLSKRGCNVKPEFP